MVRSCVEGSHNDVLTIGLGFLKWFLSGLLWGMFLGERSMLYYFAKGFAEDYTSNNP